MWTGLLAQVGLGKMGPLRKPAATIEKAAAAASTDRRVATAQYTEAIRLLRAVQGHEPERSAYLSRALLGLGRVLQASGADMPAVESFLEYRRVQHALPKADLSFVAVTLAGRADLSDPAVSIYLEFLRGLDAADRAQADAQTVCAYLEKACEIREETAPATADRLMGICQKVTAADGSLRWPAYYSAVACFARGQYRHAQTYLQRAAGWNNPLMAFYAAFSDGMLLAEQKLLERAATSFAAAVVAAPQRATAHLEHGRTLLHLAGAAGKERWGALLTEALDELQTAARLDAAHAPWDLIGRGHRMAGRHADAALALEKAIAADPKAIGLRVEAGICQLELGRYAEATAAARAALAIDRGNSPARRLLADACLRDRDYTTAAAEFALVVAADPSDVAARALWGEALFLCDRVAEAIAALEPAQTQSTRALYYLSRCRLRTGDAAAAAEGLQRLAADAVDAETAYWLGVALAHCGRYPESLQWLGKADPDNPRTHVQAGHVSARLGDLLAARRAYERALEKQPADFDLLLRLAALCRGSGEPGRALEFAALALAAAPADSRVQVEMGRLAESRRDTARAEACYREAVRIAPQDPLALLRLGVLCCRQQRLDEAFEHLQGAASLQSDPGDELLSYFSYAAAMNGEYSAALEAALRQQQRHPEDSRLSLNINRLHYLLGKQHLEAGRLDQAIEEWTTYLEPRPSDEECKRDIARLRFRAAVEICAGNGASLPQKALQQLAAAAELDPANPVYRYQQHLCDAIHGNWEGLLSASADLAAELGEGWQAHAQYHLALARLAAGQVDQAAKLLAPLAAGEAATAAGLPVALALAAVRARAGDWAGAADLVSAAGIVPDRERN
jgi:tetratricopeptide (TPR) repeat protein